MWGMAEDDVIGSIITGYEQCIIGEYNAIWVPNNTMFSYNMDTYYVFGENSSQYGLSKYNGPHVKTSNEDLMVNYRS